VFKRTSLAACTWLVSAQSRIPSAARQLALSIAPTSSAVGTYASSAAPLRTSCPSSLAHRCRRHSTRRTTAARARARPSPATKRSLVRGRGGGRVRVRVRVRVRGRGRVRVRVRVRVS